MLDEGGAGGGGGKGLIAFKGFLLTCAFAAFDVSGAGSWGVSCQVPPSMLHPVSAASALPILTVAGSAEPITTRCCVDSRPGACSAWGDSVLPQLSVLHVLVTTLPHADRITAASLATSLPQMCAPELLPDVYDMISYADPDRDGQVSAQVPGVGWAGTLAVGALMVHAQKGNTGQIIITMSKDSCYQEHT
jgi:hypothetical protein